MLKENLYNNIRNVIELRNDNNEFKCKFCDISTTHTNDFTYGINHYIDMHNYKLLNIVQLSVLDFDEYKYIEIPVAYLGK